MTNNWAVAKAQVPSVGCLLTLREQEDMLRKHKPPPIQRIRISDFGLPDPKRDLDRHQNCITWSLSHAPPSKNFVKIRSQVCE